MKGMDIEEMRSEEERRRKKIRKGKGMERKRREGKEEIRSEEKRRKEEEDEKREGNERNKRGVKCHAVRIHLKIIKIKPGSGNGEMSHTSISTSYLSFLLKGNVLELFYRQVIIAQV